nr:uncharacterized protein LOC117848780 [Setaria viridis]
MGLQKEIKVSGGEDRDAAVCKGDLEIWLYACMVLVIGDLSASTCLCGWKGDNCPSCSWPQHQRGSTASLLLVLWVTFHRAQLMQPATAFPGRRKCTGSSNSSEKAAGPSQLSALVMNEVLLLISGTPTSPCPGLNSVGQVSQAPSIGPSIHSIAGMERGKARYQKSSHGGDVMQMQKWVGSSWA